MLIKNTKLLKKNKEKNITKVRFIDLPENVKEIKHNKKVKFIAQKSHLAKKQTKKENPIIKSKPVKKLKNKSVIVREKVAAIPTNKVIVKKPKTLHKKSIKPLKKIKKFSKNIEKKQNKTKKIVKLKPKKIKIKKKREIISLNKITPNFEQLLEKGLIKEKPIKQKKTSRNNSKQKKVSSKQFKGVDVKRLSPNIFRPSHIYPNDIDISDSVSISTQSSRFASYLHKVKRKIELVWEYPPIAGEMGIQGRLFVKFVINKDGRLLKVQLLKSSGSEILDREAIRALKEAAPYPPFPKDNSFGVNKIKIHACFEYVLSGKELW